MKAPQAPPVVEITIEKAAETIKVLQNAIDSGNPLSPHLKVALSGLTSYLGVCRLLNYGKITIDALRRKLGIERPVPMIPNKEPGDSEKKPKKNNKTGKHGKRGCGGFPDAPKRYFAHPEHNDPGCLCPGCMKGRIFPDTGNWMRFYGEPFLKIVKVVYEIWRCNLCQAAYPAPIAKDLLDDGDPARQFGFSAVAMIALSKYFFGTPWARQQRMQELLSLPITASTLCDQTKFLARVLEPVYNLFSVIAANGWLFYSDDTTIKILRLAPEFKIRRNTNKEVLRTGIHTSCVIAETNGTGRIILFKSGIIHAGEFLDEILANRNKDLPPPLHMSDGSSCNPATVTKTVACACNAHGKRKLDEKKELYPTHQGFMKSIYKDVYKNEEEIKKQGMNIDERLAYHKEHSKPMMEDLFKWMQQEMDEKRVEPNSMLGEIFNYFLARKEKLMAFTKYPGAPIDNNLLEQTLKIIALLRKNAMFFMTEAGAKNGDIIMSVGATAGHAGINLYDYFVTLLRYNEDVAKNPELFLPWNYKQTAQGLIAKKSLVMAPQVVELNGEQWKKRQEEFVNSKIKPLQRKPFGKSIGPPGKSYPAPLAKCA